MIFAKKSLGQHFLRNERALAEIVGAGELTAHDAVLEIGPGEGVLTEQLLASGVKLIAVEKDDALYELLQEKFKDAIEKGELILIHGDILDFDPSSIEATSYKLIANIPYNITGAILEKFLSAAHQPERMVLLVQDEVAKRVVARDNKESILSISVKAYGVPRYVHKVPAGSFVPAPKVDSAVLSIEHISGKFFEHISEARFFTILKAGFRSKRKKLSSNLASVCEKEKIKSAFISLGLDDNTRAEEVSVEMWGKLVEILK